MPTYIEKILSTALHVNVVALKTPNTYFSHAHCMLKVKETCQYDWTPTQLINSYMEYKTQLFMRIQPYSLRSSNFNRLWQFNQRKESTQARAH